MLVVQNRTIDLFRNYNVEEENCRTDAALESPCTDVLYTPVVIAASSCTSPSAAIFQKSLINGFSVLELVICLTIICIIAFYTSPFTISIPQKAQIYIVTDDIKTAIKLAKVESEVRKERLVLSSIDENDWSHGMRLYSIDSKGIVNEIIKEWYWQKYDIAVVWSGFQSDKSLVFMPEINKSTINGKFVISSPSFNITNVIINRLGRVMVKNFG
ncbi:MAG: hypothetical protein A3E88_05735 [Legionellales bacterium RIFCSPHIGHO2_12_FULL_35_11]|nr:MAG: hypothetical protein A3E88_05735 [Legionellales bacterium RIFCSPHIGHO2_12_FULL_35_11]